MSYIHIQLQSMRLRFYDSERDFLRALVNRLPQDLRIQNNENRSRKTRYVFQSYFAPLKRFQLPYSRLPYYENIIYASCYDDVTHTCVFHVLRISFKTLSRNRHLQDGENNCTNKMTKNETNQYLYCRFVLLRIFLLFFVVGFSFFTFLFFCSIFFLLSLFILS